MTESSLASSDALGGVPTALGRVQTSTLGRTLVHEHVLVGLQGHHHVESAHELDEAGLSGATSALRGLETVNIETMIDVTTVGAGRDPETLRHVSKNLDLNIVCSTGVDMTLGVPAILAAMEAEELATFFLGEVNDGFDGSDLHAGVIVAGVAGNDPALTDKVMLATAFVHAESGVPVIARGADPESIVKRLTGLGVDPGRILLAHADQGEHTFTTMDRLADTGVVLGFTRIGYEEGMSDPLRAALLGYVIRRYGVGRAALALDSWAYRLAAGGDADPHRGFTRLGGFLNELRAAGLAPEDIKAVLSVSIQSLFTK